MWQAKKQSIQLYNGDIKPMDTILRHSFYRKFWYFRINLLQNFVKNVKKYSGQLFLNYCRPKLNFSISKKKCVMD